MNSTAPGIVGVFAVSEIKKTDVLNRNMAGHSFMFVTVEDKKKKFIKNRSELNRLLSAVINEL